MADNIRSVLDPKVFEELNEATRMLKELNFGNELAHFKTVCESVALLVNASRDTLGASLPREAAEAHAVFMVLAFQKAAEFIK